MPEQSAFLAEELATKALDMAANAILGILNTNANLIGGPFVHVVIMGINGEVLAKQDFGGHPEGESYEDECRRIARSKGNIHYRTGLPSEVVQQRHPHLLTKGDTAFGGSFSFNGIIVAASGLTSYWDEVIAGMVAAMAWGLCVDAHAKWMRTRGDSCFF